MYRLLRTGTFRFFALKLLILNQLRIAQAVSGKSFEVELYSSVTSGAVRSNSVDIASCFASEAELNITDLNKKRVKSWFTSHVTSESCDLETLTKATVSSAAAKVNELKENSTVSVLSMPVSSMMEVATRSEIQVFVLK